MIYLIKSNDRYHCDNKIQEILKQFEIDFFDIHKYDGSNRYFNYDELYEDLVTLPLFSEYKAVIYNNPLFLCNIKNDEENAQEQSYDKIVDYCQKPNYETIFIMYSYDNSFKTTTKLYKSIIKNITVYDYSSVKPKEFFDDALKMINQANINIDNDAKKILIKNSSNNYSILNQNLNKLKLYGDKVNADVVNALTDTYIEDSIFEFTNALFDKNVSLSFKIINDLYTNNYSTFQLIAFIASQLRFYIKVQYYHRQHYRISDIMELTSSKKEFRITKAIENLNKYQNINILEYLYKLGALEQTLKSNSLLDDKLRFELFILELMRG